MKEDLNKLIHEVSNIYLSNPSNSQVIGRAVTYLRLLKVLLPEKLNENISNKG